MKNFILFLCGGTWQLPWFKYLKKKGHKVILVDPNDNPPCKPFCDLFIKSDVRDIKFLKEYISKNKLNISIVTSDQTDVSCLPVAELSEHFKTKSIPLTVTQKFCNKYISREHVNSFNPKIIPKFIKINCLEDISKFLEKQKNKIVIKPADSQSSRGITFLDENATKQEMNIAFKSAIKYSNTRQVLAEAFISGTEITVEGIIINNRHHVLAMSRKSHFRNGIASELCYPLVTKIGLEKEIRSNHNKLIESTGINFGLTHSEYIINEQSEKFYLIEMACRGGGTLIPSHIVPWVSGINIYDIYYDSLMGNHLKYNLKPDSKSSLLHFFEFPSGKVKSVNGEEDCKNIPEVIELRFEFKGGEYIFPAVDDRGRQGFVIIVAEDQLKIREILDLVYKKITISYYDEIQ